MNEQRKVTICDYVQTTHGIHGILIQIKPGGYYGDVAFIATADERIFYCPISDLINCDVEGRNLSE